MRYQCRLGLIFALALGASACGGGDEPSAEDGGLRAGPVETLGETGDVDPSTSPIAALTFERFDGSEGSFADYRGKPLVVNFFASWCAPCVKEMPDIETVAQELDGEIQFLGLNVNDSLEDGQRIADQTGVTYDLARDPQSALLAEFRGLAMPTTAFVDADGNVVAVQSRSYTADELRKTIDEELR